MQGETEYKDGDKLTTIEAAVYLKHQPQTLELWRIKGQGPSFIKYDNGRVFYRWEDLRAYDDARVRTSTKPTPAKE